MRILGSSTTSLSSPALARPRLPFLARPRLLRLHPVRYPVRTEGSLDAHPTILLRTTRVFDSTLTRFTDCSPLSSVRSCSRHLVSTRSRFSFRRLLSALRSLLSFRALDSVLSSQEVFRSFASRFVSPWYHFQDATPYYWTTSACFQRSMPGTGFGPSSCLLVAPGGNFDLTFVGSMPKLRIKTRTWSGR